MTTPAASGDRGGMVLTGTMMEIAGTPGPATVIFDVALELSRGGVTVTAPGNAPASAAWSSLADAHCGEPGVMPDGSPAVAVSALVTGRLVRWLVPSEQIGPERAMAIDLLLAARTGRTDGPGRSPQPGTATPAAPVPEPVPGPAVPGDSARSAAPVHSAAQDVSSPASLSESAPSPAPEPAPASDPAPAPEPAPAKAPDPPLAAAPPAHAAAAPPAHAAPNAPAHAAPEPAVDARPPGPDSSSATAQIPAAPPAGESSTPVPEDDSRLVKVLWAVIVVLVLGGAALLGLGLTSSTPWSSGSGVPPNDHALARAVNLVRSNLPAGWTVAKTPNGPLSGFVGGSGSGGGIGSGTPEDRTIARLYEQCMGVPAARDTLMGASGPSPVAHASSPPFESPAGRSPMQVASLVDVYRDTAAVQQGAAEIGQARFASCFGQAIGKVFRQSAQASSGGGSVTYGTPTVVRLRVPAAAGVHAGGADVDLPLEFTGAKVTVQLGFVFVAGGRIEATLVTFSEASGFPSSLSRQLAGVVERNIAGLAGE